MKVEDVPQDLKYLQHTAMRDLTYATDAEGNYHAVQSVGWTPKNEALEVTMASIYEECEEIAGRVKLGQTSPLEYYMKKNVMSIGLLSEYTGISKHKIKKHFNPNAFAKLENQTLEKYADALRISVDELKHIPTPPHGAES